MDSLPAVAVLTLERPVGDNFWCYMLSPSAGFKSVHMKNGDVVLPSDVGLLLSDIAHHGYHLQSSFSTLQPRASGSVQQTQHIFVRNRGIVEVEQLRDQLEVLGAQFEKEVAGRKRENISWQEERCRLSKEMEELRAQMDIDRYTLAAEKGKVTDMSAECAILRQEIVDSKAELHSQMKFMQEQAEAKNEADVAVLQNQVAEVVAARDLLQEQVLQAQKFAPVLEECDVPARIGTPAAKHVRIACPGIAEEQIEIEPLPNGVGVKINDLKEDGTHIFAKEFQYPHSAGRFELCYDECGLDCGVLLLVLKQVRQTKFKLGRAGRSPLLPIEEDQEGALQDDAQNHSGALSPSLSQVSLGTTVSSEWLASNSERSWALVPPLHSSIAETSPHVAMSAPAEISPGRCFLKDSFLLGADGTGKAVTDLERGTQLCCLRVSQDGSLTFATANVHAQRIGMLRDADIADIQLESITEQEHQQETNLKMCVTTSHSILVTTSASEPIEWTAQKAGELRPDEHQLFVMQQDEREAVVKVRTASTVVQNCQVVEVELEHATDAVLLQLQDGVFAAVFGSPGWQTLQIVSKNESVDVQVHDDGREEVDRSSRSDPTYDRKQDSPVVYRQINRPHDAHCTAWCKFYFPSHSCKKGFLCTLCHNPEHEEHAKQQKTHRGVHKKR